MSFVSSRSLSRASGSSTCDGMHVSETTVDGAALLRRITNSLTKLVALERVICLTGRILVDVRIRETEDHDVALGGQWGQKS